MNVLRDKITFANKNFHDAIAPWYDSSQEQYHARVLEYNQELLNRACATLSNHKLRILDIGCGTGYMEQFIDTNKHIVCGIDISQAMIDLASKKFPSVSYSVHDIYSYKSPYKYDIVIGNAVLHHFADYQSVISRITSMLAPKASILFTAEPNYYCYHYLSFFKNLIRLQCPDHRKIRSNSKFREDLVEYHMYQKDGIHPYQLKTFLRNLGFHSVNLYFSSREFLASLIDRRNIRLIDHLPSWILDKTGLASRTFAVIASR